MDDRRRIDPSGLAVLLIGFLAGTAVVMPSGPHIKQDAWLTMLLGGGLGLVVAWVYTTLAQRFPGKSIMGYSIHLLGRWPGRTVGLLYIWYGLHLGALVLRNFGEFLTVALLPKTPSGVVIVTLMLLCGYAVRQGLEPLTRASRVLVALFLAQALFDTILSLPDLHLENLLPVMEHGPAPVLKGAFILLGFPFGETILFAAVLPFVRPTSGVRRTTLITMGAVALLMALLQARNIAVLGEHLVGTSLSPSLTLIRNVEEARVLVRLDSLLIANMILVGFMKGAVCLFATASSLAELTGAADFVPLVLPLGAIMAALSVAVYDNAPAMGAFASMIWPVYSVPFQILMPLSLLLVAWVRSTPGD